MVREKAVMDENRRRFFRIVVIMETETTARAERFSMAMSTRGVRTALESRPAISMKPGVRATIAVATALFALLSHLF
jgi:hypothetical protein